MCTNVQVYKKGMLRVVLKGSEALFVHNGCKKRVAVSFDIQYRCFGEKSGVF